MTFRQKSLLHFKGLLKALFFLTVTFITLILYLAILDEPFKCTTQSMLSKNFWLPKYKKCALEKDWMSSDLSSDTVANVSGDNFNTFWEVQGPFPYLIQVDFKDSPREIVKYSLRPGLHGTDSTGRMPKDWQFQGSHDGRNWITLDVRKDQEKWKNVTEKKYATNNPTAYRYYRIYITAGVSPDIVRIGKFALYERFLKTDLRRAKK